MKNFLPIKILQQTVLWPMALLTLLLSYVPSPRAASVVDICDLNQIRVTLKERKSVIVRTPSGSESNCKPSFSIPANSTLDVSIVSGRVPKRTMGRPEHQCIKMKISGKEWTLDCSPDTSSVFYMTAHTKVIFRSSPSPIRSEASLEIPTWTTNFRILLELRSPLRTSWSLDSSVTPLVEGQGTTMSCPHANERLVPGIYHDGKFDNFMHEIHILRARAEDSGQYACDFGDRKDNGVSAITNLFRLVVAEKQLLTSQREIYNATIGDRYPLYCSVKFFIGPMKDMSSSDWGRIHDILAAQYKKRDSGGGEVPSWLSLTRVSWWDLTNPEYPKLVPDATGNLSLHTDVAFNGFVSGSGADLIKVDDIDTPYFAISKIIDVVIKEEQEGKKLTYRCTFNHDQSIVGGVTGTSVEIHVRKRPPIIDLPPTHIAIIVISLVVVILIVVALLVCCVRGLPGKGKNVMREDNPLEGSNGWAVRAEAVPLNASAPSPTTPTQDAILYQPRGPEPQELAQQNSRSDSPSGEVFFGTTFSSVPPKLPSPNANGAPYSRVSLSRGAIRSSDGETESDYNVSLHNETYGVLANSPNDVAVAT